MATYGGGTTDSNFGKRVTGALQAAGDAASATRRVSAGFKLRGAQPKDATQAKGRLSGIFQRAGKMTVMVNRFKKKQPPKSNERGFYSLTDGRKYAGQLHEANFKPHGTGHSIHKDASQYRGQFNNGMPHGFGELTEQHGSVISAQFARGEAAAHGTLKVSRRAWRTVDVVPHRPLPNSMRMAPKSRACSRAGRDHGTGNIRARWTVR